MALFANALPNDPLVFLVMPSNIFLYACGTYEEILKALHNPP